MFFNVIRSGLLWLCVCQCSLSAARDYYVSPTGNDRSPGTQALPFRTLEAARDALRSDSNKGATVWLMAGRDPRKQSFNLTQEDSGTADVPIIYRAISSAEVILDGGVTVAPNQCRPVHDVTVNKRLLPTVRAQVRMIDLKAVGVTDYGVF